MGIDAGATTAIAVLDLEGRAKSVESHKHWKPEELIERISQFSPVIIACDTNPTSHLARALSRAFGAKLFFPKRSASTYKKEIIAAKTGLKMANKHERDALSAAVMAYHHYENKLRQAAKKAREAGASAERVQRLVLQGVKMRHATTRSEQY